MKRADGCLNLPALTSLYKTLQVYLPGFQSLGKLFDLPVKSFKVQAVACGSFPLLSLSFVYILIPSLMHLFILFACTCLVFVAEVRVGKNERGEGWEVEGERCEGWDEGWERWGMSSLHKMHLDDRECMEITSSALEWLPVPKLCESTTNLPSAMALATIPMHILHVHTILEYEQYLPSALVLEWVPVHLGDHTRTIGVIPLYYNDRTVCTIWRLLVHYLSEWTDC